MSDATVTITIPLKLAAEIRLFSLLREAGWHPQNNTLETRISGTLFECGCWYEHKKNGLHYLACEKHQAGLDSMGGTVELTGPIVEALREEAKLTAPPPPADRTQVTTLHGTPIGEHLEIGPSGMQKDYIVLTDEELKKGFVRPVRNSYIHVGKRPKFPTRPLTEEEKKRYTSADEKDPYVCFEMYPEGYKGSCTGRFWNEKQLKSGCGALTTMGRRLAETYARDPKFYNGTFCSKCGKHYDVGEDGEFVWADTDIKVGT